MKGLKELRESRQISQQDLARDLKVSPSAVSNWESGKRQPDTAMIITIAEYFNVSADVLLGRDYKTRKRSDNAKEHNLDENEVKNLVEKLMKVDKSYYPALESIIDGLADIKNSNHN